VQPAAIPWTRVVVAMIAAVCATLITNALDTSPTVSLIGATLAAAVPALITAGGRQGAAIGVGVTAAALVVTYVGFTAADAASDRPMTFPAPSAVKDRVEDGEPTVTTDGPKEEVEVPDVVGKLYEDAERELQDAGFNVTREDTESNEPAEQVVDQDPDAGTRVEEGAAITLSVSLGPAGPVTVPTVTELTEAEAASVLQESGFEVTVTRQDVDDPTQDGVVLAQSPSGGEEANRGDSVTVTVGQLPNP
jgi:PASTA domain